MTALSATAASDGTFVTVALTDINSDAVATITRDPSPGSITVRPTPVELPANGAGVYTDLEFPFGVEITYTAVLRDPDTNATLETLTATAGPITLPTNGMVVSDPLRNRQVLVTVLDQYNEQSRSRDYRFDLAGRSMPLMLTEEHNAWQWNDVLVTRSLEDRAVLDDLLRSTDSILLRVNGDCDLRDGWVNPGDIAVARNSSRGDDTLRRWDVLLAEVDAPGTDVETAAVTLQDLHEMIPGTLQDIADAGYTSLLDLSLGVIDYVGQTSAP